MTKILLTGASGFVGYHVAKLLTSAGNEDDISLRLLIREESNASYLASLGAEFFYADIRDPDAVREAMRGCAIVYHVAADYRLWLKDPEEMYDINVEGTKNIMNSALSEKVQKVIYTSTVGVLLYSKDKISHNEKDMGTIKDMVGHYKRSKFLAQIEVEKFIKKGLPVVIVYPSTPIGPVDNKPTPTGKIITDFLNGKMPCYLDTGLNFVHVKDVAWGHILATKYGKIGEKYILGNKNMTLKDFLALLAKTGNKKAPKIRLPYYPVLMASYVNEALSSWITKKPPLIPLSGVKMAKKFMYFDSKKAVEELKMPQTPIENAIEEAVAWFIEKGYVKS